MFPLLRGLATGLGTLKSLLRKSRIFLNILKISFEKLFDVWESVESKPLNPNLWIWATHSRKRCRFEILFSWCLFVSLTLAPSRLVPFRRAPVAGGLWMVKMVSSHWWHHYNVRILEVGEYLDSKFRNMQNSLQICAKSRPAAQQAWRLASTASGALCRFRSLRYVFTL